MFGVPVKDMPSEVRRTGEGDHISASSYGLSRRFVVVLPTHLGQSAEE